MQAMLLHELCEFCDAERRFVKGQQEITQEAADGNVERTLREHLEYTGLHARKHKRKVDTMDGASSARRNPFTDKPLYYAMRWFYGYRHIFL